MNDPFFYFKGLTSQQKTGQRSNGLCIINDLDRFYLKSNYKLIFGILLTAETFVWSMILA
jgi:hypothetical protein